VPQGSPAPATTAEAAAEPSAQLEKLLSLGSRIIAPATLISTLLFYFGYVSSRAQYDYFGLDVDVIGLSTQDYVMRSPQPLLVPLLVLTLLGAASSAGHLLLRRRAGRLPGFRYVARRMVAVGVIMIGVGVVLLFGYAAIGRWTLYPLVTPLILAAGGTLAAYGLGTLRWLDKRDPQRATWRGPSGMIIALWVAVAASLFWATATVAQWSGRGLAGEQARTLDQLPSVIVDSKQRLFLPAGAGVRERDLTGSSTDQPYRYRYSNLRLLIEGDGAMFLVPSTWSPAATTIMLPLDSGVHVQFQFRNEPP
jgi:hypothetical protein